MKDGRTHLAYKAEHAVDLGEGACGAVLAVNLETADQGDTTTLGHTLAAARENLQSVSQDPRAAAQMNAELVAEVVADQGYLGKSSASKTRATEVQERNPSKHARSGRH